MKKLLMLVLLFATGLTSAFANDSAVETAAGGLKLRKERSVLMEKERLFISEKLVRVEYEFRNTGKTTVSSEVAFPIPPYEYMYDDLSEAPRNFENFKAWVDGKPIKVKKEIRAFVKGREVTEEIRRAGIEIETFGDFDPEKDNRIYDLEPGVSSKLAKVGALEAPSKKDDPREYSPRWETHVKYYWHQDFPPGKVVRIKHEYRPVWGFTPVTLQSDELKEACMDADTLKEVNKRVALIMQRDHSRSGYFSALWVSYILTTANTWQTPIKDFELTVQRDKDELVTFCWDGPVENIGDGKFRAHKKDFVPAKDLKIYFLKNF